MVDYICPSIFSYIVYNPILYRLWLIHHYLSAETVVYRIFYCLNRIGSGHLSLRELKRGNLLSALRHADDEEDINKVLRCDTFELNLNTSAPFCPYILSCAALWKVQLFLRVAQHWTYWFFFPCRYFSYEHFYVIYCKFWELDTDHDFLIDKENLIKYGNHALTYRIVDRIFSEVGFLLPSLTPLPYHILLVLLRFVSILNVRWKF